jgi:hypothetical protein
MQLFRFDRGAALVGIEDPDCALWTVNAFSDVDELKGLVGDALTEGIIARERPTVHLAIYSMSISEPDPQVAVGLGEGPALLGHSLKLRERESESPVDFTLRLLEDMVSEANALAASRHPTAPGSTGSRST